MVQKRRRSLALLSRAEEHYSSFLCCCHPESPRGWFGDSKLQISNRLYTADAMLPWYPKAQMDDNWSAEILKPLTYALATAKERSNTRPQPHVPKIIDRTGTTCQKHEPLFRTKDLIFGMTKNVDQHIWGPTWDVSGVAVVSNTWQCFCRDGIIGDQIPQTAD